jgi:subtilisin family serine protease
MEADTWRQLARVRLMVGMIAPLVLIAAVVFAGHEQTANHEQAGKRKMVIFREGTTPQARGQIVEHHGAKVLQHFRCLNGVTIELPNDEAETALAALRGDRQVVEVHNDQEVLADHVVSMTPVPPPSGEIILWHQERVGLAPELIKLLLSYSSLTPTVAILDTGIDIAHPEFEGRIVGGFNARTNENPADYRDFNGHGTHITGEIVAALDGAGIFGTADPGSVAVMAVKVLDDSGNGYLSDLINGLEWVLEYNGSVASEQRIRVVNMSLSFSRGSSLLEQVIKQVYASGVTMVASAGNLCPASSEDGGADDEGGDLGCDSDGTYVKFPAAYSQVIAVVGTDINNELTLQRSGPEVDLAAPGKQILSTIPDGGYSLGTGSSQAAAQVAAAVAVVYQLAPWSRPQEVAAILKGTAKDLGYAEAHQGAGLLAVDAIVKKLLGLP